MLQHKACVAEGRRSLASGDEVASAGAQGSCQARLSPIVLSEVKRGTVLHPAWVGWTPPTLHGPHCGPL